MLTSERKANLAARIVIVDDHPMIREGLAAVLQNQPSLELCGVAADVDDAIRIVRKTAPDLAIVDVSLKTGNGIDLVKRLKAITPTLIVLVWSMHAESLYAERALRAGARGYVNKGQDTDEIVGAIYTVLDGRTYVSAELSERLIERALGTVKPSEQWVETLTDRELEVFELLGQGLTTQQIADRMRVSRKTVETFRARIKEKLGLTNAHELLQHAMQWTMNKDEEGND
jgi:DNA-binding NarL/FixJ family response regulator